MIHFALLFSRQGKVRLSKYYVPYSQKERGKLVKEVTASILRAREAVQRGRAQAAEARVQEIRVCTSRSPWTTTRTS